MSPAVLGMKQYGESGVQEGIHPAAGRPTGLRIQKTDRIERACDTGGLQLPVSAAVGRMLDGAPIAHCPPVARIDKTDVVQAGVVSQRG